MFMLLRINLYILQRRKVFYGVNGEKTYIILNMWATINSTHIKLVSLSILFQF